MLPGAPARRLPRSDWLAGLLIVTAAAGLRVASIDSGVPAALADGEARIMERAFGMLTTGDYHPQAFDSPALYVYMQAGLAAARFLKGTLDGAWFSLNQVSATDFYVWGRGLTAFFGTLTVLVTWRIGRRISPTVGLVAAAFLALQPQHVRDSHYVLADVPMACFAALALFGAVRAHETAAVRAFLLAGVAAGLAAATAYAGGLAVVMPLVAVALTPRTRRALAAGAVVCGALGAFLLAAPHTLLDLPGFLNGLGAVARERAAGAPAGSLWWPALVTLSVDLGFALAGLALAGIACGMAMGVRATGSARVVWASAAAFVALGLFRVTPDSLATGRYALPVLPALMILAGGTIALITRTWMAAPRIGWMPATAGLTLALVVTGPLALRSSEVLTTLGRKASDQIAYEWLVANTAPGMRVVVEAPGLRLPPRVDTRVVRSLIDRSYDDYLRDGTSLVVASSQALDGAMVGGPSDEARRYHELFRQMQLVFSSAPSRERPGSVVHVYRIVRPRP